MTDKPKKDGVPGRPKARPGRKPIPNKPQSNPPKGVPQPPWKKDK